VQTPKLYVGIKETVGGFEYYLNIGNIVVKKNPKGKSSHQEGKIGFDFHYHE
jgi:hypothetical protein